MRRTDVGRYAVSVAGSESVRAFVPTPLPPVPPLHLEGAARDALDQALLALGRLDGAAATLPDVQLLLYTYQRKEAVLSSQIEGRNPRWTTFLLMRSAKFPACPSPMSLRYHDTSRR